MHEILKILYTLYICKTNIREYKMAVLDTYNINAMATQISREFYIQENPEVDKSYVLRDEMNLFALDMKQRVKFISRVRNN